jgi:hypothetical protein
MTEYMSPWFDPSNGSTEHAMRFIDPSLWAGISAGTALVDHRAALQAAIDYVVASVGIGTLILPAGVIGIDCSTTPLIIPTGIRIRGAGCNGFATTSTTIRAMGHSRPTTANIYGSAMIYVASTLGVTLEHFAVDRAGFDGDGIVWINCTGTTFQHLAFSGFQGTKYKTASSANAGTDIITGPSGTSALTSNGQHIQFWVGTQPGDALPTAVGGDLATLTKYFLRDKSGNTFKVSRTVGGAAIDITANGTGLWGFYFDAAVWESSSTGTDTINITTSPFVVGQKVACTIPHQPTLVGLTMPNFVTENYSYWVVATPTADSFQIATSPGGTPITVTTTGGLSNKPIWALEYSPIRGSGNLYAIWDDLRLSGAVTGYKILIGEAGGGAYYGVNVGRFSNLVGGVGHTFHGICTLQDCSFEGSHVHPSKGAVRVAGAGVLLDNVYIEAGLGTSIPVGYIIDGAATMVGCNAYGPDVDHAGSIGLVFRAASTNPPTLIGCNFYDYDYDFTIADPGGLDNGEANFVSIGGDSTRCNSSSQMANQVMTGTQQQHYIQHKRNIGYQIGGAVVQQLRQTANNPTTLELGLGNVIQIEGNTAHTISTITTAGVSGVAGAYGWRGELIANSIYTTLSASVFKTLSGANYLMASGEALPCAVDVAGKLHLAQPMGSVVAGTPAGLQGAITATVADQSIFSAAPTAGRYEVSLYLVVGTTGSASSTVDIPLKWNDGTGRTLNVIASFPADSTGYKEARATIKVASGNPTLALTYSGTGSPSFTLDASIRRVG